MLLALRSPSSSFPNSICLCLRLSAHLLRLGCAVCVLGRFVLRLIIAFVFLSKYRARCRQRPRRRRRRSWRQDKPKEHVFLSSGSTTATTTTATTTTSRMIVVVVVESSWKHFERAYDMKHAALQINFGLSHSERYKSHVRGIDSTRWMGKA